MKKASKSMKKTGAQKAQNSSKPPLAEQPAVKSQAARQGGMFLYTDDKWSLAYFDKNDLHCEERELFG